MQRPGGAVGGHAIFPSFTSQARAASHRMLAPVLQSYQGGTWMRRQTTAVTATNAIAGVSAQALQTALAAPACFPALLAPNKGREIGGGRATRQPGQVRKEAALTRSGSGRSSVSYLFFERIAQAAVTRPALDCCSSTCVPQSRLRETINCGSIDDRRWRSCNAPQTMPEERRSGRLRPRRSAARPASPIACWRANTALPVSTI